MKEKWADKERIGHIIDSISNVEDIMLNISFDEFNLNLEKKLAIERLIEIIGEASNYVSIETRLEHSQLIPWGKMIGTRNFISHEYGKINYELIYQITIEDLPKIKPELEKIYYSF